MFTFPMASDEDYAKHRAYYLKNREQKLETDRIRLANRTPEQIAEDKRKQAEYRERVRKHNELMSSSPAYRSAFIKSRGNNPAKLSNGKN